MTERMLLLSWTVPPETTGSAVIVGNLAKQFSRAEMVVAGERPYQRPAVVWKEEWPEIVYVANGWPDTRRGARWWRRLRFPMLVANCLSIVRRYGCTALLVVAPREEYLFAGYLTAKLTGTKLYAYFHNTYLEQCRPHSLGWKVASWIQGCVFKDAQHVFLMSKGMEELYRERYPGLNCSVLVHSFNEPIPAFSEPPEPAKSCHFVISGNINESCQEAAIRVCRAVSQVDDGSLTILSGSAEKHLRQLGILDGRVRHETIPRDILVSRLREADIVLLPHGFSGGLSPEEYRTIFPSKTIEYLICGRPILAHALADCYLTRFLKEHHCALVIEKPTVEAVLAGIKRLRGDANLRSTLVRNALRAAETFRASHVASTLRSILEKPEGSQRAAPYIRDYDLKPTEKVH